MCPSRNAPGVGRTHTDVYRNTRPRTGNTTGNTRPRSDTHLASGAGHVAQVRLVVVLLEFNRKVEDDELFGQALLVLTQVVFAPKMRLEVVVVAVKLVLPQSAKRA